jgi:plastocyanin
MVDLRLFAALILAAAPVAAIAQSPATVRIDVESYSFAPKPIVLRAGTPVTLTFVNGSGKSHDFTAREFFAASRITSGAAPDGEVDLPSHGTVSVTLVPARGTYKAHCGHFMHEALGMKDQIIVQ